MPETFSPSSGSVLLAPVVIWGGVVKMFGKPVSSVDEDGNVCARAVWAIISVTPRMTTAVFDMRHVNPEICFPV